VNEVNEKEAELLMLFGTLKEVEQDDIIDFIKLKLHHN
jgi:hypothetical protein